MSDPSTGRLFGDRHRIPRALHPAAWWIWAIGLATAASRTTNPILLILVLAVLAFVVTNRRTEAPWARAFRYYFLLALTVVAIRVVFRVIFGAGITPTDHIIIRLPVIPTPSWYAGIQIGGPVSLEATLSAVLDGLRLGTLLCCVGAANALANPKRALRVLPGALYELGTAVVVAINIAPQLIESGQRVRLARRLRADNGTRRHVLRSIVIPVVEDAFERSLALAAAMDSRGYGRTGNATRASRRLTGALLVTGLLALCVGMYGLLDASAPAAAGLPALLVGAGLCGGGLVVGSRRVQSTQYRPDPWRLPEWVVSALGINVAIVLLFTTGYSAAQLNPSLYPLQWPSLPVIPALAILLAGLAGFVAPPPPKKLRRASRAVRVHDPVDDVLLASTNVAVTT
jgi:energy-coupling factor transport system permease protein